jgi:hypothetical protein
LTSGFWAVFWRNYFVRAAGNELMGLEHDWVGGDFRGLKAPANRGEQARYAREAGSSAALRNDSHKSKGRSRFPEGMTERKAKVKVTANAGVSPLRITKTGA